MNEIYKPISKIKGSIIAQIALNVVGGITALIMFFVSIVGTLMPYGLDDLEKMSGEEIVQLFLQNESMLAGIVVLALIFGLAYAVASLFFINGLGGVAKALDIVGRRAVNMIRISAILSLSLSCLSVVLVIIGSAVGETFVLAALSLLMILALLVGIAILVMNILGYSNLRGSNSLDELGQQGANKLFWGYLFSIIASLVSYIPFVGFIATIVLVVMSYVYLLSGWSKIQRSTLVKSEDVVNE